MADVFISYARADEKIARRLAAVLQGAGHSLWWDADLPAHRSYSEEIESHLRDAKAVVVLWSKDSAQSQWVRAEADVARNDNKLVQLSLDGTMPPLPFNQIQCADLTGWRGGAKHGGLRKMLDSVASLSTGAAPGQNKTPERLRWWRQPRLHWAAAAAILLLLAGALLLPRFSPDSGKKPIVAVLPFESLDKSDAGLVAGIWEDTRQAIGRNPQLLVLGPNTAEEIAEKDGKSAAKLADYLVEASVRSSGGRIRVSANLVRTDDGSEIWNKSFDRQLDDVFQLQQEIAGQIEGHIRGRLAERGGVQPENIATSGEVYALYSDARAKIRKRDILQYGDARDQLRQVVALDPNFAPGWATLSVAEQLYGPGTKAGEAGFDRPRAQAHARRAISLAPNLAAGHAALGFALKQGPQAEASLKRAIALDSHDYESLNWLAGLVLNQGRRDDALRLYERASEIEPLFWPAVLNKLELFLEDEDYAAAASEQRKLLAADNKTLASFVGIEIARHKGDLSEATKLGLQIMRAHPAEAKGFVGFPLFSLLLQLGYEEEARASFPSPPFGPFLWRNDPRGLDIIEGMGLRADQFFALHPMPMNAGRVYLLSKRGRKLAELYRQAVRSPEEMSVVAGSDRDFVMLAPFLALGLREAQDGAEADRVLAAADRLLASKRLDDRRSQSFLAARVHVLQGQPSKALQELTSAISAGWLPRPPAMPNDIGTDPAFASLKSEPRFQQVRQRILDHVARERAELGPLRLN